jgi:amino acid adenylation domain-containing protein
MTQIRIEEEAVAREIAQEVSLVLRLPASGLASDQPLFRLGLDSLSACELAGRLEERWGHRFDPPSQLWDRSVDDLARELAARSPGALAAAVPPREAAETLAGVAGAAGAAAEAAEDAAAEDAAPLSHGQRALWYLRQLAPASGAYHLAGAARIVGDLDRGALLQAFQALLDRHPALRSTFAVQPGEEPVQQAHAGARIAFEQWQAQGWSEPELVRRLADYAARPFDLERGPLLRVGLAERGERGAAASVLLVAIHHIAADFWSLAVLTQELGRLYEVHRAGLPAAAAGLGLPPPPPAVLAARQRRLLDSGEGERLWAFWSRQLAGAPQQLQLPADRPRPRVQGFRGGRVRSALTPELTARLGALGLAHAATPFTALLGGFLTLLHRISGQDDLLVGVPTSGRDAAGLARAVGYHVNPVVVRSTAPASLCFAHRLAGLRQTLLAAFAHQALPFALLAERFQPQRDPGCSPLFQAMAVLHRAPAFAPAGLAEIALGEPGARLELGALSLECVPLPERASQLDLALFAATVEGRLVLHLQYDSDLFDAVSARRLLAHLQALLGGAVAQPGRSAAELPLLSESELHQLVREWSSTGLDYERRACLHDLVAAQAARTPEATALVCGRERLTYRDLAGSAGQLAAHLRGCGAGPEVRVAVLAERSPELVIGLLAVLAAGAAYVPLDPSYPAARLAWTLDDARPRLLLAHRRLRDGLPAAAWPPAISGVDLDGRWWESAPPPFAGPAARAVAGNLAYLIYTSGSTGRPKAVAVEHRSAVAFCAWAGSAFLPAELAGVLAATSIGFDLSIFELFVPLACGGTVILVEDALALTRPGGVPEAPPVTLVNTVPSAMAELLRAGAVPASVVTVALAGEALHGPLLRAIHEGCAARRVLNLYGPSEDTIYSTGAELAIGEERPTIGRPLANRVALVLDSSFHPVPIGVSGELFAGGAGLARGYFARPEATAETFVPDAVTGAAGGRLYRTGDLARTRADGRLEFLGRRDHQVKVRGFRLELGEVDAALAGHPGVRAAVTLLRDDAGGGGERRLVAYVVRHPAAAGDDLAAAGLDSFLRRRLPAHAVPQAFVFLADLPRGAGGKVDRAALPAPAPAAAGGEAPRNPLEEVLAALWCEALERDAIGVHDDLFALGAHSLLAARVAARLRLALGQDLPLSELLASPTVAGLAARLTSDGAGGLPLAPVPRQPLMPASAAQRRLWFLDRLSPGGALYNLPLAVHLRGALDGAVLGRALDHVACRHESLRTLLDEAGGRPWQRIAAPSPVPVPLADLARLPPSARQAAARTLARAAAVRPFDLAAGPLLRCQLLRLAPADHVLVVVLHHAVADAASLEILLDELAAHCQAFAAGAPAPWPAPPLQYADYASWEQRSIEQGAFAPQVASCASRLQGAPAALALPVDRPRPAARSGRGGTHRGELPPAAWSGLLRLARAAAATPFMLLLAAWTALLHRLAGEEDIVVGTPIANRDRVELEPLIGMFVNTLAVRCAASGGQSSRRLVTAARDSCLAAYAHRQVPFDLLVEALRPGRLLSHNPLFDVLLVLAPAMQSRRAGGLELAPEVLATETAKFDLTLFAAEHAGGPGGRGLELVLESDRDLFDAATAARLLGHLVNLLAGMAAAPEACLDELQLLGAPERHQVMVECNAEAGEPAPDRCLHELVLEQAERTPEAVAVDSAAGSLTYGELARRAELLGRHLAVRGVGPEVVVGVFLERSHEMVVALLGTLAAGGAYLPLDPTYPEARLRFMLEDSGAAVVVTRGGLAPRLPEPGPAAVLVEEVADDGRPRRRLRAPHPDNLAYLIYTSGSTGRPKGVALRHRGAVARLRWAHCRFSPAECAAVLASTSICFDLSVFELFVPLSRGGRVVLVQDALELPAAPTAATLLNTVPSVLAALLRQGGLPASVHTVNLAGEALPANLAARLAREPGVRRILNLYGPSEDTTYSTCAELPRGAATAPPPIGRPLPGTSAHALDRSLRPLALGVAGELYLGGVGLARGYHARPELTAERFVPSPFGTEPGARLYRTGDLVRRLTDGSLDFLGRADQQVKIRGFRIEPGEIEAALLAHPGVREAAVAACEDAAGALELVAYLVPAAAPAPPPSIAELQAFLRGRLPEPFVPARVVTLAALPVTASGKLDRRALPAPGAALGSGAGRQPAGPLEEVLAAIWAEVLGRAAVGAEEDFFALGGHSLLAAQVAARVRAAVGVELPLRSLFEAPTVAALAARVGALRGAAPPPHRDAPLARSTDDGPAPLSPAQQRLWLLHRLEPESPAYHIAGAIRLAGALRPDALAAALAAVVRRQHMLRAAFPLTPAGPVQVTAVGLELPLPRLDLRALPAARRAAEARRLAQAEARRPFDLERGPPARLALVRLAGEEHLLLATLHHIAADGWSLPVLLRDLASGYGALLGRTPPPPAELPIRYVDYARAELARRDGEHERADLAYWRQQLAGSPPVLELPGDRPRPRVRSDRGRRRAFSMPAGLPERLAAAGRSQGASSFMVLLAAFLCLLRSSARQEDLLVGTPVANRDRVELEEIVGCFVNTLVLRTRVIGELTFAALLARVREVALAAFDHRHLPFERLVEELRPGRDLAHTPIFQILLVLQNAPVGAVALPGLSLAEEEVETATAKFDLTLTAAGRQVAPTLAIEYASDLFDGTTISRLAGHLLVLLDDALASPERRCDALRLLGEGERHQLVAAWNDTRVERAPHLLHALCELQAARTPEAVAVVHEGQELRFGDLDRWANRIAHQLLAHGAGPGAVVGICAERSPELVAGLLGILKAGAAYLPLDPAAPRERLAWMAAEADAPVLLAQERLTQILPAGFPILLLDRGREAMTPMAAPTPMAPTTPTTRWSDRSPGLALDGEALAYVIYTSGSTGRPKGVMNSHRAVVNRLLWMQSAYTLRADDRVLHKTPFGFDVSVWELFWPLLAGARLVLAAAHGQRDAAYLLALIGRAGITVVHFVPAMLQAFLDQPDLGSCASLRLVVASGEALPPAVAQRFHERVGARLENLYGPTEAAVDVTSWPCAPTAGGRGIPIGRPIANARILLLDDGGRPAPIGIPAELYIGGVALARGYLGRPELTAEKFVPDPYAGEPGARLYRTGDLARLLPGGEVDFLGRLDHQVKVRGVRIEPGEIEAALLARPELREAVVAARDEPGGGRRLVAYLVPVAPPGPSPGELRDFLRERLPEAMVPAAFVYLDRLPVGRTGKLDRRALPEPERQAPAVGYLAPRTAVEAQLAALWAEVLGLERAGVEENFFDLGGHSLLATQLMSRIGDTFHLDLALREVFAAPTVSALAEVVTRRIVDLAGAAMVEDLLDGMEG